MSCVCTKFPKPNELEPFYGKISVGDDGLPTSQWKRTFLTQISLPYVMRLSWNKTITVNKLTCHKEVASSLQSILGSILDLYGSRDAIKAARMDLFGGCYNFRTVRGGHTLSMHAYGAAIDLDPEKNPRDKPWKANSGMMPVEVIEIFKDHGWAWGGDFKSRPDCMHFEGVDRS